jgi:hypothetical protein
LENQIFEHLNRKAQGASEHLEDHYQEKRNPGSFKFNEFLNNLFSVFSQGRP